LDISGRKRKKNAVEIKTTVTPAERRVTFSQFNTHKKKGKQKIKRNLIIFQLNLNPSRVGKNKTAWAM
jgi:hypothetical protein